MRRFRLLIADEGVKARRNCDKLAKTQRHGRGSDMANMLDMISAKEAKQLVAEADPEREMAANDTLSQTALHWAMKNAIGRTDSRIRTYAKFGRTQLSVKFAPSDIDHDGEGNSFYNDLLGNSNSYVADAISDIIYGREQTMISPIQTARLLNTYSAQIAKFVRDLERLGYRVSVGESDDKGNGKMDDSTIIINWE